MSRSCYNKEYADGYYTSVREFGEFGTFTHVMTWIPHTMSKDCRYDQMKTDPECKGCKWNKNS